MTGFRSFFMSGDAPRRQLATFGLVMSLWGGGSAIALAQTPSGSSTAGAFDRSPSVAADSAAQLPSGPIERPLNPLSGVQIDSSSTATTFNLKISDQWSHWRKSVDRQGYHTATTNQFTVNFAGPVSTADNGANLVTLDGLATAGTVSVQFSQFVLGGISWRRIDDPENAEARAICQQANVARVGASKDASPPAPTTDTSMVCDTGLVEKYANKQFKRYLTLMGDRPSALFGWSLTGKIGEQSFKYYNAANLSEVAETKTPWSAGGAIAWFFPGRQWAVTAQAQYQNAYKAAATKTLCPAGAAGSTVTCISGAIGAPTFADSALLSLEVRGLIPAKAKAFSFLDGVGVDPVFTYDALSHAYGFDLPIYLVSGKGGLTGGVRADWTSVRHAVTFGVFFTQPFNLFAHQ